jgi:hypothetical protein
MWPGANAHSTCRALKRPQNMEERCYSWRARDGGFLKGRLNGSEAASEVRNDCPA